MGLWIDSLLLSRSSSRCRVSACWSSRVSFITQLGCGRTPGTTPVRAVGRTDRSGSLTILSRRGAWAKTFLSSSRSVQFCWYTFELVALRFSLVLGLLEWVACEGQAGQCTAAMVWEQLLPALVLVVVVVLEDSSRVV